jgi:Zn-finger nucleic acid-binding protein
MAPVAIRYDEESMAYRDRPITCPRCRVQLQRHEVTDRWRCAMCSGIVLGIPEIVRELLAIAPDLLPSRGVAGITTIGRRSATTLTCPACGAPMDPVFLGGVHVDRCYHDELIWFDDRGLDRVLATAQSQREARHQTWLERLVTVLFRPG